MPSDIGQTSTEEIRLRNHLAQVKQREDVETRELERQHADEVQRLIDNGNKQLEDVRQDYEVRISQEAESLEQKLHDVRAHNQERVEVEQKAGEKELERVKLQNHQKIGEYRKNGEVQLDDLRKQLQFSAQSLHDQARKREKMERELAAAQEA